MTPFPNPYKGLLVLERTEGILSEEEFREFWITIKHDKVFVNLT